MDNLKNRFRLQHMTQGAVFFLRTGIEVIMAAGTLLVKSISDFGHFVITFCRIMALPACLRPLAFIIGKFMMAVLAGKPVAEFGAMRFVIKQDLSGCRLKH